MRLNRAGAIVMVTLVSVGAMQAQNTDERHVYVTALDKDGTPIVGLTTGHFAIRESGTDRTVVNVEPLRIPMHVAVLVDTSIANGAPDEPFRSAVVALVERLGTNHHVAVYSFGDRAARAAQFTQDAVQLRSATTGIFGWAHQRSLLIDAIDLALDDFEKVEPQRPVIVAITSESPEASSRTAGRGTSRTPRRAG